mmetsp:Transcript_13347/g.53306  ORF Transcript_13347/g.53306 Transcript_13347/m.53306 type:complete len:183 (+) Transcript_13347:1863-2411(+)
MVLFCTRQIRPTNSLLSDTARRTGTSRQRQCHKKFAFQVLPLSSLKVASRSCYGSVQRLSDYLLGLVLTASDGSFKSMDLLDIGDRVRSSETEFSTVFLFTRRMQKDSSLYMIVGFESGESLSVASSHYLLDHSDKLILAEEVAVGDVLYTEKVITSIRRERRMGVYHPHTLNDVLYVDGIR